MEIDIQLLRFLVLFILGWFFWFQVWIPYRIDTYRQDLFALRDELFQLASDKNIPYNDPVYSDLRNFINGIIRFAHRVTFTRVFFGFLAQRLWPDSRFGEATENWLVKLDSIENKDTKELLFKLWMRVCFATGRQLLLISPIGLAAIGIIATIRLLREPILWLTNRINPMIKNITEQAIQSEAVLEATN